MGSHVLTHIAVPTFYLISGFLFFNNFNKWSWSTYKRKIKSRIKTLFIPYILWNLLPFLLLLLYMLSHVIRKGIPTDGIVQLIKENSWHIFYDCNEWGTTRVNWLGEHLRMTGPYDFPLWFLRDLIVVTLLTPIIYYSIKKFKVCFILFLFIAYVSRIWTLTPGFHITAFFYFSTGAYFALNGLNIVSYACKYKFTFTDSWCLWHRIWYLLCNSTIHYCICVYCGFNYSKKNLSQINIIVFRKQIITQKTVPFV